MTELDLTRFLRQRLLIWWFWIPVYVAIRCFAELARRAVIGPWW